MLKAYTTIYRYEEGWARAHAHGGGCTRAHARAGADQIRTREAALVGASVGVSDRESEGPKMPEPAEPGGLPAPTEVAGASPGAMRQESRVGTLRPAISTQGLLKCMSHREGGALLTVLGIVWS